MAGYIRQDTSNNIADGNVINSSDFDNEYNAIEAAFHATTGHTHDGTSAEGAPITKMGPAQDLVVGIAAVTPKTDNTLDLGSSLLEFKDLYIDGVANIDSLVADTADINAGTIDGTTIGGSSAAAGTFTTATATTGNITTVNATTVDTTNIEVTTLKAKDGTAAGSIADTTGVVTLASSVLTTTDINGGTIDGVTIGGASAGAGTFTTATATTGNITTVNATTVDTTNLEVTNIKAKDGTASATIADSTGVMTIASAVLTTADINGGTLDNVVIGGSTPAAGNFTNLDATGTLAVDGNVTLGDASTDTVTVNGYMGVGGAAFGDTGISVYPSALVSTTQNGIFSFPVGTSAATSAVRAVLARADTAASSFTAATVAQFWAANSTKGAGSTITNQHGLYIADQTQGTNNYGITSLVSSGTNKWNIYASGTAANAFAGSVRVGGTTAPVATLDVTGSIRVAHNNPIEWGGTAYSILGNATTGYLAFNTNSTERLRIDSTGALIAKPAAGVGAVFNEDGVDADFRVESDTNTHALFVDAGNSRVGVNMSDPGDVVHIQGASSTEVKALTLRNEDTTTNAVVTLGFEVTTGTPGDAAALTGQIKGVRTGSGTTGDLAFWASNGGVPAEVARITSNKYLRMASGTGGIQFNGDTAAANALDDYEQGTFTPAVEGTTTAGTGTYVSRSGKYTKIGNVVYFSIYFNMTAHTGTGNMVVTGLPFTSYAAPDDAGMASFDHINGVLTVPTNSIPVARIGLSATTVFLYSRSTAGTITDAALALDAVTALTLTGFYYV